MSNRGLRNVLGLTFVLAFGFGPAPVVAETPNIVIIYTDDQGWADLGVAGGDHVRTPRLDRMAAEGRRFTSFYVAQPVCSASRAALLTGCYPNRIGIHGALGPGAKHGISADETTLAELCRARGYATAVFGKWHLGHHPEFLPPRHGFDEFIGIPYSNDMWPRHPETPDAYPPLPLLDGTERVAVDPDQRTFTTGFTRHAVDFIRRHRAEPFFLYLAHPMPHVPLFVDPGGEGATGLGLYADVIGEIDDSVGRILDTLAELDLDERTLVLFASDNGPWLSYGDHAGRTGPLREGKGTTFEGGVRVPAIIRWPGRVPAGTTTDVPLMTIDVLPTIAEIIGAPLPERPIDGRSALPLWLGAPGAGAPQPTYYFYYHRGDLEAIRHGRWKLHFPHGYRSMRGRTPGSGGRPGKYDYSATIGPALFDLEADPGERNDLAAQRPTVVARLEGLAERARDELGDRLRKREGRGVRPAGRLDAAAP